MSSSAAERLFSDAAQVVTEGTLVCHIFFLQEP